MKKQGISLIEALLSSALVFFLLTGSAQLILTSLRAKRNADFHLVATVLASSRLETLKSFSFDDPLLREGNYGKAETSPFTGEKILTEWAIEDIQDRIKKIVYTIFSPSSPSKRVVFVLLISRDLDF